jgi:hypothetical protein
VAVTHHLVVPWYAAFRAPGGRFAELARYCQDRDIPVVCYPRPCDSVAFYLHRGDLRSYRSKDIDRLRNVLRERPRTIVLCTHRHSLRGLRQALPPELRLLDGPHFGLKPISGVPDWLMRKVVHWAGETALGLCDVAVVERRK